MKPTDATQFLIDLDAGVFSQKVGAPISGHPNSGKPHGGKAMTNRQNPKGNNGHAKCCRCGQTKPLAELNGFDPLQADYSRAYCRRLAACRSTESAGLMDGLAGVVHESPPEDYRAMDLFVLTNIAHIDRQAAEELSRRRREGGVG